MFNIKMEVRRLLWRLIIIIFVIYKHRQRLFELFYKGRDKRY